MDRMVMSRGFVWCDDIMRKICKAVSTTVLAGGFKCRLLSPLAGEIKWSTLTVAYFLNWLNHLEWDGLLPIPSKLLGTHSQSLGREHPFQCKWVGNPFPFSCHGFSFVNFSFVNSGRFFNFFLFLGKQLFFRFDTCLSFCVLLLLFFQFLLVPYLAESWDSMFYKRNS